MTMARGLMMVRLPLVVWIEAFSLMWVKSEAMVSAANTGLRDTSGQFGWEMGAERRTYPLLVRMEVDMFAPCSCPMAQTVLKTGALLVWTWAPRLTQKCPSTLAFVVLTYISEPMSVYVVKIVSLQCRNTKVYVTERT